MSNDRLTFVVVDEGGTVKKAWPNATHEDHTLALSEGADRADELVAYLNVTDDRPMFGRVMREACANHKSPISVGFMDRIAERLKIIFPVLVLAILIVGMEA